jgi:hypothetical protein
VAEFSGINVGQTYSIPDQMIMLTNTSHVSAGRAWGRQQPECVATKGLPFKGAGYERPSKTFAHARGRSRHGGSRRAGTLPVAPASAPGTQPPLGCATPRSDLSARATGSHRTGRRPLAPPQETIILALGPDGRRRRPGPLLCHTCRTVRRGRTQPPAWRRLGQCGSATTRPAAP